MDRPILPLFALLSVSPACGGGAGGSGGGTTGAEETSGPGSSTTDAGTASSSSSTGAPGSSSGEPGSSSSSTTGGPSGPVLVQLLAINDFHGYLDPPSGGAGEIGGVPVGGVAHLAADVASLRAEHEHSVFISAGDLIGGSPITSGLLNDEPTIEAMDLMGLDIVSMGNHEFDDGLEELLRMKQGGCHPQDGCVAYDPFDGSDAVFLAANVTDDDSGETIFAPVEVRTFEGVSIAFIGLTMRETPALVSASAVAGLSFHDEVATVEALMPDLEAQGVEAIVVVLHQSGAQLGGINDCLGPVGPLFETVAALPEAVDVVIAGHSHGALLCEAGGKLVTSAGAYGALITEIDLELDRDTGEIVVAAPLNHIVERDEADPEMAALVEAAATIVAPLAGQEIGTCTEDLTRAMGNSGQSALGGVIADAQLAAVSDPDLGGAQMAFMNHGGIRADILHAPTGEELAGVVTYGELFAVHPFGNAVTTRTLTGAQLHDVLEEQFTVTGGVLEVSSNFTYAFSNSAPVGDKVDAASMILDGVVIELDDEVRVAVNDHVGGGGGGYTGFMVGTDVVGGPVDVEALAAYFEANSPVAPAATDRVTVLP